MEENGIERPGKEGDYLLGIARDRSPEDRGCVEEAAHKADSVEGEAGQRGQGIDFVQNGKGRHVLDEVGQGKLRLDAVVQIKEDNTRRKGQGYERKTQEKGPYVQGVK